MWQQLSTIVAIFGVSITVIATVTKLGHAAGELRKAVEILNANQLRLAETQTEHARTLHEQQIVVAELKTTVDLMADKVLHNQGV